MPPFEKTGSFSTHRRVFLIVQHIKPKYSILKGFANSPVKQVPAMQLDAAQSEANGKPP